MLAPFSPTTCAAPPSPSLPVARAYSAPFTYSERVLACEGAGTPLLNHQSMSIT